MANRKWKAILSWIMVDNTRATGNEGLGGKVMRYKGAQSWATSGYGK